MTVFAHILWPVARALGELVLPSRCAACNAVIVPGAVFCAPCDVSVVPIERCCARCGAPDMLPRCARCTLEPPVFDWARGAMLYGGELATAITRFKYARHSYLARPLARLMMAELSRAPGPAARRPPGALEIPRRSKEHRFASQQPPPVVVPVPLHRRQLAQRGFNQAALLARYVARHLGLPLAHGTLARIRDTERQVGLSRRDRLVNVRGAFCARPQRVVGAHVLLIDDVMTTGATASACSLELLSVGALGVAVLTLARAIEGSNR